MQRSRGLEAALALSIAMTVACSEPVSSPAVQERRGLAISDPEVLRVTVAFLTDPSRADEWSEVQRLRSAPRVLVFDRPMPLCGDGEESGAREVPGCFQAVLVDPPTAKLWRERGDVAKDAIRGNAPPKNVEYISAAETRTIPALAAVVRERPVGSAVVALSAPAYPTPHSATVFCRRIWEGYGLVHLEYGASRWAVTAVSNWRTY
jgi:hypothetical protein